MATRKPGNQAALCLHIGAFAIGLYGLGLLNRWVLPPAMEAGGSCQFVTTLAYILTVIYHLLGMATHAFGSKSLFAFKGAAHVYVYSLESVVCCAYWSAKFIIPSMVAQLQLVIPWDLDLAVHVLPLLFLTLDFWLFMPPWTSSPRLVLLLFSVSAVLYLVWLHYGLRLQRMPYPFMDLPYLPRAVVYAVAILVWYAIYQLHQRLYTVVVGSTEKN